MERVIISNYDEYGDPVDGVGVSGNSVLPIDVQARLQTTIQTHNAVSVGAAGTSFGSWIDTDGFDRLAITLLNDNSTDSKVNVQWSNDGSTLHGETVGVVATGTGITIKDGIVETRSRYARLRLFNLDGALAHTMSAWAYLKV